MSSPPMVMRFYIERQLWLPAVVHNERLATVLEFIKVTQGDREKFTLEKSLHYRNQLIALGFHTF